jgi:hypothetical protein
MGVTSAEGEVAGGAEDGAAETIAETAVETGTAISGIEEMDPLSETIAVGKENVIATGVTETVFEGGDRLRRDEVGRRQSETSETLAIRH